VVQCLMFWAVLVCTRPFWAAVFWCGVFAVEVILVGLFLASLFKTGWLCAVLGWGVVVRNIFG
jgi:hypothetical protein